MCAKRSGRPVGYRTRHARAASRLALPWKEACLQLPIHFSISRGGLNARLFNRDRDALAQVIVAGQEEVTRTIRCLDMFFAVHAMASLGSGLAACCCCLLCRKPGIGHANNSPSLRHDG